MVKTKRKIRFPVFLRQPIQVQTVGWNHHQVGLFGNDGGRDERPPTVVRINFDHMFQLGQ